MQLELFLACLPQSCLLTTPDSPCAIWMGCASTFPKSLMLKRRYQLVLPIIGYFWAWHGKKKPSQKMFYVFIFYPETAVSPCLCSGPRKRVLLRWGCLHAPAFPLPGTSLEWGLRRTMASSLSLGQKVLLVKRKEFLVVWAELRN